MILSFIPFISRSQKYLISFFETLFISVLLLAPVMAWGHLVITLTEWGPGHKSVEVDQIQRVVTYLWFLSMMDLQPAFCLLQGVPMMDSKTLMNQRCLVEIRIRIRIIFHALLNCHYLYLLCYSFIDWSCL